MKAEISFLILFIIATAFVVFLLYIVFYRPEKVVVYNELPVPAIIPTHHWGYGWRPWWRRFNGVPGFKPLEKPKLPIPPKPIVIPKAP